MIKDHFDIKINNLNIIKLLFYIFPFMMLMASGYITSYVTILTIASLIFFYKNNIKIKFYFIDYLVFIFFFLSLISTFVNIKLLGNLIFFKSTLDLRFALFFLIIRNVINYKLVDIKKLFLIGLICTLFLSIDIIYQHIYGADIFGIPPFDGRFNGVLNDEAIAGSYIQKFLLFSLSIVLLFNLNNINKFILTVFISSLLGAGILLSLDRMPFFIYLFILSMLIIFFKNYRSIFVANLLIILFLFNILLKNVEILEYKYQSLGIEQNVKRVKNFIEERINKKIEIEKSKSQNTDKTESTKGETYGYMNDYLKMYNSAFSLWLKKPFLGSGVKSFGPECGKMLLEKKDVSCNVHPHNIYLEILINQGLLGIITFISLIILIIKNLRKEIITNNNNKFISIIFIIILIAEVWPLRTYGSIFQTMNGSIFWFLLALVSSRKYLIK